MQDLTSQEKPWFLYLLFNSVVKRSYIGITVDIKRRIRQHNCELTGGANYTQATINSNPNSRWDLVCFLAPFSDRSQASRWERLLKFTRGRENRLKAFEAIGQQRHPEKFSAKQRTKFEIPKLKIYYSLEQYKSENI